MENDRKSSTAPRFFGLPDPYTLYGISVLYKVYKKPEKVDGIGVFHPLTHGPGPSGPHVREASRMRPSGPSLSTPVATAPSPAPGGFGDPDQ